MQIRSGFKAGLACATMLALPLAIAPIAKTSAEPVLTAQANVAVGYVNPNQPIQIEVVNAGGVPIRCRLTLPATDERTVAPGGRTTFGSLNTSYLPVPIYFLAFPENNDIGLSLYVITEGNRVEVVMAQARSEVPGSTAMNIDPDGGIYIY
jgi:hypothetical protein